MGIGSLTALLKALCYHQLLSSLPLQVGSRGVEDSMGSRFSKRVCNKGGVKRQGSMDTIQDYRPWLQTCLGNLELDTVDDRNPARP